MSAFGEQPPIRQSLQNKRIDRNLSDPTCTERILSPMRFVAPAISDLRLRRLHRWAMLWLTWFAAFLDVATSFAPLSHAAADAAHHWLDRIEYLVVRIVFLRYVRRMRRVNMRKGVIEHRRIETSQLRAIMGTRTWSALRSKHLHIRIAALRQNLDALVARVLRRLPRGLTRRRPIRPRPERACIAMRDAFAAPVYAADTS